VLGRQTPSFDPRPLAHASRVGGIHSAREMERKGDMRAWRVHEFGAPTDVLRVDEVGPPEPGPGEVQIAVEAITINFNDIDGIRGRYRTVPVDPPYIPGMEVLGRVRAVGDGGGALIGTRVCAVPAGAFGGYAEVAVAPVAMTFAMPEEMDTATAASVYMPFHVAYLALYERGRLSADDTVLVHAAAGGVGSAALQLARARGARVIATAGSPQKLKFARELGADVAIDYSNEDFVRQVLDATGGRGVDVAFDTVGGATTLETFRCMAFGGRHLLVGFASGIEAEDEGIVPRPVLFGNFSLVGVCHAYTDDALEFKRATGMNFPSHADGVRVHRELLGMIDAGTVRPVTGSTSSFSALPEIVGAMESRATIGRNVVIVD
jgi:NADPH:quinone reductase